MEYLFLLQNCSAFTLCFSKTLSFLICFMLFFSIVVILLLFTFVIHSRSLITNAVNWSRVAFVFSRETNHLQSVTHKTKSTEIWTQNFKNIIKAKIQIKQLGKTATWKHKYTFCEQLCSLSGFIQFSPKVCMKSMKNKCAVIFVLHTPLQRSAAPESK